MTNFYDFMYWTPLYWGASLVFPILFSQYEIVSSHFIGLSLGLSSVALGQVVTVGYYMSYNRFNWKSENRLRSIIQYISQPEGFLLLGTYLSVYWITGYMPTSYYSYKGGIYWDHVLYQLLIQDFLQFCIHRLEHKYSILYKIFHQSHHRYTSPTLLDAFDGSIYDTMFMILIPLFITSRIVSTNVWSYMIFGTIYSNILTLIHSEVEHPWDWVFSKLGIGTPMDHRIHHRKLKQNYGHIFVYWDQICGTKSM